MLGPMSSKMIGDNIEFMKETLNFNEYFTLWLEGLNEEIHFWKKFMENKGGASFVGWEKTISPERKFELESEISKDKYGKVYKFADIGSGPFSNCGRITDKVKLEITCIDPLASVYKTLKSNNNLKSYVNCETGFVELLYKKFGENVFDMVHMSNSLDHCFDPVYGIYQLLYICDLGGQVILRHNENEAENGNYKGMHQWNLSLNNPENSFIIWNRKGNRYDICEIFKEYAVFKLYPEQRSEDGWIYNKVVMTKRKNIRIPQNTYYEQILSHTYEYLLQVLLDNEMSSLGEESWIEKLYGKMSKVYDEADDFSKRLRESGIDKVIIYGMGEIGKRTIHLFKKSGIEILTVIDKQEFSYMDIKSVSLDNFKNLWGNIPLIVVAIKNGKEEVIERLKINKETHNCLIKHIDELL